MTRNIIVSILVAMTLIPTEVALAFDKQALPRFGSIKSHEANTRRGPGAHFPALHVYLYKGLPVEILTEYEGWRQIRDINGDEGWIHSSILSNKRSIIIKTKEPEMLYRSDNLRSRIIAKLAPNLVCSLNKCSKVWCKVKCQDYTGYVSRSSVWGVYQNEEW